MLGKDASLLLLEINKTGYKSNDWEKKFLNSIGVSIRKGRDLTDKQSKCLESIYANSQGQGRIQRRTVI